MNNSIVASLVVVMRNEERYIGRCIDSILQNDFPSDEYEILIADGMSEDGSRSIVLGKQAKFDRIKLLDNRERIVPTGLNIAIQQAQGKYVFILGAHAEYPSNYISTCIRELETRDADVVGGRLNTKPGSDTLMARAIALITQHPFGVGNANFRLGRAGRYVDTVPYGAYKREIFEKIGFFNERLVRSQDFELNARIRGVGGKIFLSQDIEIDYYNVPTMPKFLWQGFTKGNFVGKSWVLSPVSFCWRHAVPFVFLCTLSASILAGILDPPLRWALWTILGGYLLFAFVASTQLAFRNGLKFLFASPMLFLSYHLSYGLGTVLALLALPGSRQSS